MKRKSRTPRTLPFVSGWDDENQGIEDEPNPREVPEKEILWAAENGELDVVQNIILSKPECLHITDKDGYTPLHRACYNDHVEIVDFLLQKGADINAKTKDLWQPIHSACMWNNEQCVAKLLEHGANINAKSQGGQTPLHLSAKHGKSQKTLMLLLTHPLLLPDIRNHSNETAAEIVRRSSPYYFLVENIEPCINNFLSES